MCQVSDYLEVIRQPMDLSTVMTKIDTHQYLTVKDFLVDIDLICTNALEYNPDKDPGGEEENYIGLMNTQMHIYVLHINSQSFYVCKVPGLAVHQTCAFCMKSATCKK